MLLYQSWSICLQSVPCPAPLIKDLTSKQLKVALQTWHTPEWKHLLSSQAGLPRTPRLSWFPQPSERALPLSSRADPHIYNPTPTAAETFSSLGPRACTSPSPHPLPCPHVALCQCGHLTAERTAPVLLSPHHSLSRGREGWRDERGGGKGGGKASVLLPQSSDCWNADRSICHPLPSHTHLLSEGLTLSIFLLCSLSLSLLSQTSLSFLVIVWSSWAPPLEISNIVFLPPCPLMDQDP